MIRYISLFSGLGGAELAFQSLGWECVAVSEIDKAACAVLQYHYPSTLNLGDVTKITKNQIETLGIIDLVIFGFPCQDLSVAGKREGLINQDGEVTRSGLFFDAMRIVRWSKSRYAVAENVSGLFSSNQGVDFASVVGEMAGICPDVPNGGWENSGFLSGPDGLVEWGVLDAQFFGVPQRRRRVFVVRDIGDWRSRPPILLERESLQGNYPPLREARKEIASSFTPSSHGGYSDGIGSLRANGGDLGGGERDDKLWPSDVTSTLDAQFGSKYGQENQHVNGGCSLFVPCVNVPSSEGRRPNDGQLCGDRGFL